MHRHLLSVLLVSLTLIALALVSTSRVVHAANQVVSNCANDDELRADLVAMQNTDGGTLTFNCGTATIVLDAGSILPCIERNTTINGGGTITLSGGNSTRLFCIPSFATLTLNNLTLTKGYADGDGGAIYNDGTLNINGSKFLENETTLNGNGGAIVSFGPLNITNSEFGYNKAANGGALYPTGARAVTTITGSSLHHNESKNTTNYGWGGAIYMSAGADVKISTSTVSSNKARAGDGIYNYNATATLTNATVSGNSETAFGAGGGIYNTGTIVLTNVTVSDNHAYSVGGIYNKGSATLINVTVSGNGAFSVGGIGNSGTATLTNVTMSGNTADTGGGISHSGGSLTLKNTLIAKGTDGANCSGFTGGSFNLSDDYSCGFGAGRDNVPLLLGALGDNGGFTQTHLPQSNSPAVNGGTNSGAPNTDQRGLTRIGQGTAYDVGSVEVQNATPTPTRTAIKTATRTTTKTLTRTVTRTPTKTVMQTVTRTATPAMTRTVTRTPTTQGCTTKPGKPNLTAPGNGTTNPPRVTLKWTNVSCENEYRVMVKEAATGDKVFGKRRDADVTHVTTNALPPGDYKWFVKACNDAGCTKSATRTFSVQ